MTSDNDQLESQEPRESKQSETVNTDIDTSTNKGTASRASPRSLLSLSLIHI